MSLRPKRELSATPTPVSRLDQVLRVGVAKTSMPVFEQQRILLRKIKEANDRHDDSEELRLSRELDQLTEKRKKDERELVERRVSTAHIQAKVDAEEAKLKREKAIRQLSTNRKYRLLQLLLENITRPQLQEDIELIREYGIGPFDVNAKDEEGMTALIYASQIGEATIVKLLLTAPGINVNAKDGWGWTALYSASAYGHVSVVKALLAAPGIELEYTLPNGRFFSALWVASEDGQAAVVKLLLAAPGIDVDAKMHGSSCLDEATKNGHVEVVKLLLDAPDFDELDNAKIIKFILNSPGIDVASVKVWIEQERNAERNAVRLRDAAFSGDASAVRRLAQTAGINVNAKNHLGWTALMLASSRGHTDIVQFLVGLPGINVNAESKDGRTAVALAFNRGDCGILEILLDARGIDVNAKNEALVYASIHGQIEVAQLVLRKAVDIDVNWSDDRGGRALIYASQGGHTSIVQMLLDTQGIDVNAKADNGDTALIVACAMGHMNIILLLLDAPNIDITVRGARGRTALVCASEKGNVAAVKLLLKAGPTYSDANRAREHAYREKHMGIYRAIDRWMQGYYKLRYEIEGEGGIGAAAGAMKS